jgi:hypothetical protein
MKSPSDRVFFLAIVRFFLYLTKNKPPKIAIRDFHVYVIWMKRQARGCWG